MIALSRSAKVYQAHLAHLGLQDDIRGLDVLVNDRAGRIMQILEDLANLDGIPDHLFARQASSGRNRAPISLAGREGRQIVALDVLHDDIVASCLLEKAVDAGDARMTQASEGPPLVLEPLLSLLPVRRVARVIVLEHLLDDTEAIKGAPVLCQVDGAHPTFGDRSNDAIVPVAQRAAGLQLVLEQPSATRAKARRVADILAALWAENCHGRVRNTSFSRPARISSPSFSLAGTLGSRRCWLSQV
jgi:hypothetical protein